MYFSSWDYGKLPAVAGFDLIEYSPTRDSKEHIQNVLDHDYVLTLDELPKFE